MRGTIIDRRYQIMQNIVNNPTFSAASPEDFWIPRFAWARTGLTGLVDAPAPTAARFTKSASDPNTGSGYRGWDLLYNADWTAPNGVASTSRVLRWPVTSGNMQYMRIAYRSSRNTRVHVWHRIYLNNGSYGSSLKLTLEKDIPADTWTVLSLNFTPSNSGYCCARVESIPIGGSWAVGDTIDGTTMMIGSSLVPVAYADGDSPGWEWDGAAGLSSSHGWPRPL